MTDRDPKADPDALDPARLLWRLRDLNYKAPEQRNGRLSKDIVALEIVEAIAREHGAIRARCNGGPGDIGDMSLLAAFGIRVGRAADALLKEGP